MVLSWECHTLSHQRSYMLFIYSMCDKASPKYDVKHPLAGLSCGVGHGGLCDQALSEFTLCQLTLGTRNLSSVMLLGFVSGLSCRRGSSPALKLLLLCLSWSSGPSLGNLSTSPGRPVLRGTSHAAKAGRGLWAGSSVCCLSAGARESLGEGVTGLGLGLQAKSVVTLPC